MAQPSIAVSRLDLSMTYREFSLRANRMGFGWMKILPALLTGNLSQSEFPRINLESLLHSVSQSDERAAYSTYARDTFQWDKDDYALKEHGKEETVDDQLIEMYGDIIDAEAISRDRAIDYILRRIEFEVANRLFSPTWQADSQTGIITPWSDSEGATPITDIDNAIEKVEDRIGTCPNTLVLTDRAWRALKRCDEFLNRIDMGTNDNPANITKTGFLTLFDEIDELVITKGYTNTANKGQGASLDRLWDDSMAMVCCCSMNDLNTNDLTDVTPTLGRVLLHQEGGGMPSDLGSDDQSIIVEEYREEARRGGVIRARTYRQIKILHEECGELLTNAYVPTP